MNWVGLVVGLAGVVIVGLGLFRAFWPIAPGPAYRDLSNSARGDLERRVRRRPAEGAANGSAPGEGSGPGESDHDLGLLLMAADIMVAQRNLLWVWLGCFLLQFGTALAAWNSVHLLVTVLFAVGVGGLALYFERRAEAGAVFLARHPGQGQNMLESMSSTSASPPDAAPHTGPEPQAETQTQTRTQTRPDLTGPPSSAPKAD